MSTTTLVSQQTCGPGQIVVSAPTAWGGYEITCLCTSDIPDVACVARLLATADGTTYVELDQYPIGQGPDSFTVTFFTERFVGYSWVDVPLAFTAAGAPIIERGPTLPSESNPWSYFIVAFYGGTGSTVVSATATPSNQVMF